MKTFLFYEKHSMPVTREILSRRWATHADDWRKKFVQVAHPSHETAFLTCPLSTTDFLIFVVFHSLLDEMNLMNRCGGNSSTAIARNCRAEAFAMMLFIRCLI